MKAIKEQQTQILRRDFVRIVSVSLGAAAGSLLAGCGTGSGDIGSILGGGTTGGTTGSTTGGGTTGGTNGGGTTTGGATAGPTTSDFPQSKVADFNDSLGSPLLQAFTLSTQATVEVRLVARYGTQAAIITPDQVDAFQKNQPYSGAYIIPNGNFGTFYKTLPAGDYYIAARNNSNSSSNKAHFELDIQNGLTSYQYAGQFITSAVDYLAPGAKKVYNFTLASGNRHFILGCDLNGLDSYLLPSSEVNNFLASNATFKSFTDYNKRADNDNPYYEIHLAAGSYALALHNLASDQNPYTYHGDFYQPSKGVKAHIVQNNPALQTTRLR